MSTTTISSAMASACNSRSVSDPAPASSLKPPSMSTTTTSNTMAISLDVGCNFKDLVELVDRLGQCFHWLSSKNAHMYFWKTELTIEKLKKAMDALQSRFSSATAYKEKARRNGWQTEELAQTWIDQGRDNIRLALKVVESYQELMAHPTASVHHCPWETLLRRRRLNCEAILRLNDILDHMDAGKEYHAERRRADDAIPSDNCSSEEASPPVSEGCRNKFQEPSNIQKMKLSGLAKYHAFPQADSLPRVPVMIRVKAPAYTRRSCAAIDLVVVLDASERMKDGGKFNQLKKACKYVILNLDARDRLSIVTFGWKKDTFELTNMSGAEKRLANKFVRGLKAHTDGEKITDANEAMKRAYKILDQEDGNSVKSVIVLSDGQDKTMFEESSKSTEVAIRARYKYPTYTFGFGQDHDPRTLYYLATCGDGGTYSFVTKNRSIRDAMALCIGGLTSIVAQDVRITIHPARKDVKIQTIMSGGYRRVGTASIDVKDLYASEEKKFIVYVNLPREEEEEDEAEAAGSRGTPKTTKLLAVTATYYCPLTRTQVSTDKMVVSVERPSNKQLPATSVDIEVSGEVTRADMFNRVEKVWLQSSLRTSYMDRNLPVPCKKLRKKLTKLDKYISSSTDAAYEAREDLATDLKNMKGTSKSNIGLPYMLSWLSSHRWQRAATPGSIIPESRWFNFRTTINPKIDYSVDIAPIDLYYI